MLCRSNVAQNSSKVPDIFADVGIRPTSAYGYFPKEEHQKPDLVHLYVLRFPRTDLEGFYREAAMCTGPCEKAISSCFLY